jgi:hypothetical protein
MAFDLLHHVNALLDKEYKLDGYNEMYMFIKEGSAKRWISKWLCRNWKRSARNELKKDLLKQWCTRAPFWGGYRRNEATRKENQEKSAFSRAALRHREL